MRNGKKRIFFLGDFTSPNGPGVANANLRKNLEEIGKERDDVEFAFSDAKGKIGRLAEIAREARVADALVVCNFTRMHATAAKAFKRRGKPFVYRMRGLFSIEKALDDPTWKGRERRSTEKAERYLFLNADVVAPVSWKAAESAMTAYPELSLGKLSPVHNGFDFSFAESVAKEVENDPRFARDPNLIMTVGTQKCKNAATIANAVGIAREKTGRDLRLLVVGKVSGATDAKAIIGADYVYQTDSMKREFVLKNMNHAAVYVQNSSMETFGNAIVESLASGCSLVASRECGALGIMGVKPEIVERPLDPHEVADAIVRALENPNGKAVLDGLARVAVDGRNVAKTIAGMAEKAIADRAG